jgi:hypothetical protein
MLFSIAVESRPVTADCCEHDVIVASPLRHIYKRMTFVGPKPSRDCVKHQFGTVPPEAQKSQSPYGAPSLVDIVVLFGENELLIVNPGVVTATGADALVLPPTPVHVMSYERFPAALCVTLSLPLVCGVPLHAPLALHEVALVLDQVRVRGCPTKTFVELVEITTVGGLGIVSVATLLPLPSEPEQVRV